MQTKDSLQTYTIMEKSEAEACLDLAVSLVRENLKTRPGESWGQRTITV